MNNRNLKIILRPFEPNFSNLRENIAYKYLSNENAANNFLKQTWIPGVNQNRLSLDKNKRDPNEYFKRQTENANGTLITKSETILGLEGFSLTAYAPDEWSSQNDHCVKINDVKGYMNAIYQDISESGHSHLIEFFTKECLLQLSDEMGVKHQTLPARNITFDPLSENEYIIPLIGMSARKMPYNNTAGGKDIKYSYENEIRIEFNFLSILNSKEKNPDYNLYQLIKYLKLSTPSVYKYCTYLGQVKGANKRNKS